MRLLLIEDHAAVADVLRDALCEEGHEVSVAHSGEEGLREFVRDCPDAVLLDVRLPAMSGVAVLREIRAQDRQLPVLVMSGVLEPQQIEELEMLGVSGVMEKPDILRYFDHALAKLTASPGS
jgi:DNA-binding response OmpR family regulator